MILLADSESPDQTARMREQIIQTQIRHRRTRRLIRLCTVCHIYSIQIGQTGLRKQWRPWSDAAERGVWSGSTLFVYHPAFISWYTCMSFPAQNLQEKGLILHEIWLVWSKGAKMHAGYVSFYVFDQIYYFRYCEPTRVTLGIGTGRPEQCSPRSAPQNAASDQGLHYLPVTQHSSIPARNLYTQEKRYCAHEMWLHWSGW